MVSVTRIDSLLKAGEELSNAIKQLDLNQSVKQENILNSFLFNQYQIINIALQQLHTNNGLDDLFIKFHDAREACSRILEHEQRISLSIINSSLKLQDLINKELNDFSLLKNKEELKNNNAFDSKTQKLQQAELSLLDSLNQLNIVKNDLDNLSILPKHIEEKIKGNSESLLKETKESIALNIESAKEYINSSLNSAQNEFDVYTKRGERKIEQLTTNAQSIYKEHSTELADTFIKLEDESANRIQVRIQKAEAIATDLTKRVQDILEEIDEITSSQKLAFSQFIKETRDDLVNSINSSSSVGVNDIQKSQSKALSLIDEKANEDIADIKNRIKTEVDKFESKRKQMDALLEKVGLATDADVTITQANKEEKTANDLRKSGLLLLYISIGLLVAMFAEFIGVDLVSESSKTFNDLTWEFGISRSLIPAVLFIISWIMLITNRKVSKDTDKKNELVPYVIMFLSIIMFTYLFSEFVGIKFLSDIEKTGNSPNLIDFVFRFMTVLLVSSPAIYMLKESAAHRGKENLYRQRGTQLVTISGYLSDLKDEPKAEVKKQLAKNFFSFHDGKADTSNVPDFIKNMNEAISLAKSITPTTNHQPASSDAKDSNSKSN
ncbi:hypothetical protein [Psychromonas sp. Urea-02u-13]|uniref:hypothetical protein n=1 Tax=Psychromonas sp. Urea-02u-13 TaxID=2058326 RepID=UPI000C3310B1|nr:hypothetical protein [Psychromonas sp. Urea-02u-13]PKG37114.1 hypothetical protein CXF74_20595 [Psychromonas sp. Urea-02u-13]